MNLNPFKKRLFTADEAFSYFMELHELLQKINKRCDEIPRLRSLVEVNLGHSMEQVVGACENALLMIDKNRKQIDGNEELRKRLTARIEHSVKSMQTMIDDMKAFDEEYERISREKYGT